MCKHQFIVIEWEIGWYDGDKFNQPIPKQNANLVPIQRATKIMCRECKHIENVFGDVS